MGKCCNKPKCKKCNLCQCRCQGGIVGTDGSYSEPGSCVQIRTNTPEAIQVSASSCCGPVLTIDNLYEADLTEIEDRLDALEGLSHTVIGTDGSMGTFESG